MFGNNVDRARVIDKSKSIRLATYYLVIFGTCCMVLGYFTEAITERNLILIIACFAPINMVVLVFSMLAQATM